MKKYLPAAEILALCAALALCALLPSALSRQPEETEPPTEAPTEAPTVPTEAATAATDTVPQTEPPTEPPAPSGPDELIMLLHAADRELSDISGSQLIIVSSEGSQAEIYAYERDEKLVWSKAFPTAPGYVGKNGVSENKREGDKKTPAGLFPILWAFGNRPDPGCKLPYRQSTDKSYWVDDPSSQLYNQWVEDEGGRDWKSAEHIVSKGRSYDYAAVIGYNVSPVVPGAGSAIFLHVSSDKPTSGCVSMAEDRLLEILTWLDPEMRPEILIF